MSTQAARQFRRAVNASADLRQALRRGGACLDITSFAARYGYTFTRDELQVIIDEAAKGMLPEMEGNWNRRMGSA